MNRKNLLALFALCALLVAPAVQATTITVINLDGPNEGYNDPTPVAPVGGNTGTTKGQQRLIAVQFAADVWASILQSAAPIIIDSQFNSLACNATSAVLASAGAQQVFSGFTNAEIPGIWYHVALANKLAGGDLAPGPLGTTADDIFAQFNSDLDNPVCLGLQSFYYGLDNIHGTDTDLVATAIHEIGHGLGFANFANELSGTLLAGRGDIFSQYTLDTQVHQTWNQMATNAERVASALRTNRIVWNGRNAKLAGAEYLAPGTPLVRFNSPAIADMRVGEAQFGPLLSSPGVTGDIALAIDADEDGAGTVATTTDGCSAITSNVAGKIAMVDRGNCTFVVKAKSVQDAGAIGLIVADNAAGSPPAGMSGVDPLVVIPTVRITRVNGNEVRAALGVGTVNATIGIDLTLKQGLERTTGGVLLNAPDPATTGSSISHWDTIAFPNLTMEPAISRDLTHGADITVDHFVDLGWFSDFDGVPDGVDECVLSDTHATVVIGGCDSGVANTVFANGCRISDSITACADGAGNHGGFVSCVSHYTNDLKKNGTITGAQKGAIQSCAGSANLP
ncbi:MAG TPA: PA domain-containing protein [Thermoanaerobaculia bacterium]|jgi:hypothetical protein|nr:PA domain-containing protein [Thermoanaerobaculia bacterium]